MHLTTDGAFAVFHDWTLDCRTDGSGVTRDHTLAQLQSLDLGYNTDDGSGTFALRGTAIGAMPSLDQVFSAGMDGKFLINIKSDDPAEGRALAARL